MSVLSIELDLELVTKRVFGSGIIASSLSPFIVLEILAFISISSSHLIKHCCST